MTPRTGRAFIVSPFSSKSNAKGEAAIDFQRVHKELIDAARDSVADDAVTAG